MSLLAKFVQGRHELDVTNGRYRVDESFVPPISDRMVNVATGTSANRYSAGTNVGERFPPLAYTLALQVRGNSAADVNEGIRVLNDFLARAGNRRAPLEFHHRSYAAVDADPLWGTSGTALRYEVIGAKPAQPAVDYGEGDLRTKHLRITVNLTLKPTATGLPINTGSAKGGLLEDDIGSANGRSTGLRIPESNTNKFTNPVFGASTYDTGWSLSSGDNFEIRNNPDLYLFNNVGALVTAGNVSPADFTQSIDVGNTNSHTLSYYARRRDGAEVTSSDTQVYYGGAQTSTYIDVGNGWYRVHATFAGVAAATDSGVRVQNNRGIHVDGFQLEESAYITPLCYGDMLGCAWSGTAHASTSTRTAARLTVPENISVSETHGTVRVAWYADRASTAYTADAWLFEGTATSTSPLQLYYDQSATKFDFSAWLSTGTTTNNITWAAGDIIIFHLVYGDATCGLYINGVLASVGTTQATSSPDNTGSLYIGTANTAGNHIGGKFMDFATYAVKMSASEVLEDYNNQSAILDRNEPAGRLPWLWTKDGDDIIDNCDDSTRDNWCVIGGVPGNIPARAVWRVDPSATDDIIWIGNKPIRYIDFKRPDTAVFFDDRGGTVDANACGGEYEGRIVISPADENQYITVSYPELIYGKTHVFARFYFAGAVTETIAPRYRYGSGGTAVEGDIISIDGTTAYKMYYIGQLYIAYPDQADVSELQIDIGYSIKDGANYRIDYIWIVNGDMLQIRTAGFTVDTLFLDGLFCQDISSSGLGDVYEVRGDPIVMYIDAANLVSFNSSDSNLITSTYTVDSLRLIPRWTAL